MTLAQPLIAVPARTISRTTKQNTASVHNASDRGWGALLQAQAQAVSTAAHTFYLMIGDVEQMPDYLSTLHRIQDEASVLLNPAMATTAARFLSPINKVMVCNLSTLLAAIMASIETAASKVNLYELSPLRDNLDRLVGLLLAAAQETKAMIAMLHEDVSLGRLLPVIAGIQALETHSNKVFLKAVSGLKADTTMDKWSLTLWQQLYESVEQAIGQCAWVARIVQGLPIQVASASPEHKT
jgi:uncharacterized protein Yka (UPF0111/DUF47 family)